MQAIKISAVSYINSIPFIYGIEHSGYIKQKFQLFKDIPSECGDKLLKKRVDLGLVPIAIIPQLETYEIISDFCIGSNRNVRSVILFSDVPLRDLEAIYLDYQSRTSALLTKILAKFYWKIDPVWFETIEGYEQDLPVGSAGLLIGDRTFFMKKKYKFIIDLAEEWYNFTGLPFAFACWVANKNLDIEFLADFNSALEFGVKNIATSLHSLASKYDNKFDEFYHYLTHNISYKLDDHKRKAMSMFFNYAKEL